MIVLAPSEHPFLYVEWVMSFSKKKYVYCCTYTLQGEKETNGLM